MISEYHEADAEKQKEKIFFHNVWVFDVLITHPDVRPLQILPR